ncbi:methyltransferase [uncultured Sulfitobacter sp.]|uniref:methyltransferase family protein n=1 Tax=uncultured Sulfitobacter sp. TaxID=191468 RepID=UPI002630CA78|nr:methyltransferase [uncultured Sulfitobacter sp.]
MTTNGTEQDTKGSKRLFWTASAFYALIAFEFFYMASPFAAYFYSIYGPGMDWLQALPVADWTLWFILPHLVEDTRSLMLNYVELFGLILLLSGLLSFVAGVFQVYRAKLTKSGAVTRGVYRYIRHPQYASLIIASLGMLLVWPRFLVLFSTSCVILAYVLLARSEERQCLRSFPSYADYMETTGMFWPRMSQRTGTGLTSTFGLLAGFVMMVALVTAGAFGLRSAAIGSLYTLNTDAGVFLSVAHIDDADLASVAQIVLADVDVQETISAADAHGQVLAYVLPTEMYVSEIPMHLPAGAAFGHSVPRNADPTQWKVILTQAEFGAGHDGANILREAVNKSPLSEVHIDLSTQQITNRYEPPQDAFYNGRQVPIF